MAKINDFKLGPTGRFPRKPVYGGDEGEIRFAIAADHANGLVRVEFGKPVAWLGLPAKDARGLAAVLIEKADALEAKNRPLIRCICGDDLDPACPVDHEQIRHEQE